MRLRSLKPFILAAIAPVALVAAAEAAPDCVKVRGQGVLSQPAGPLTDWVGPVTLKVRGETYEGEATVHIDPSLLSNVGPPTFRGIAFDWFTLDFGEAGQLMAWELAVFAPLDPSGTRFVYDGIARPGTAYLSPGVYGSGSTGMFAVATGVMTARGKMKMTFPEAPNAIRYRFSGRLCGLQLP